MADHSPNEPPLPPTVVSGAKTGAGGALGIDDKIGDRYTIVGMLGFGGMGAVYKAWDDELGVNVAIKTIAFAEGTDAGTRGDMERRFKREAQLARQITHRNVVRIHDIGDVDGLKYLTMALVEGETLAAMIRRAGPLPVADALPIARQIVDGLVAAHEVGVIHRDLKPENVMVTPDGHAYIMDFGIALSAVGGTQSSVFAGTLEYMAPEQGRTAAVDSRVDVYAFGLILYDMLTGRKRLQGHDHGMSELMWRMDHAPDAARTRRPDIPEPLDALITRATQPKADARFKDALELHGALSGLANDGHLRRDTVVAPASLSRRSWLSIAAVMVIGVLMLAGAAWRGYFSPPAPAGPPQPISVIIANFDNRTGDPIFDGLIEQALSVGVESASFISAYPRRDAVRLAAQYPDKTVSVNTATLIALREGLAAVVTGAIEKAPRGYRLPIQVLRPGGDERLLFDAVVEASSKDDVLNAVGRLAVRVRSGLGDATINQDRVNINETFTANSLEAAAAYVLGQNMQAEGRWAEALAAYQEAVKIDPDLGRAWSGLGGAADNMRRRDEATAYYNTALSKIDRMTERERFRTRGAYYATMGNADAARDENEALIKRFPSDSTGLNNLALAYFNMWNFPRALELGKQAAAIYPGNVLRQSNVALYALYASDFRAAATQAEHVLALNKDYPRGHLVLALAHLANGEVEPAIARYRTLGTLPAIGREFSAHGLADVARYRGRLAEAATHLETALAAETAPAPRARFIINLASVRLAQGRTAEAIKLVSGLPLTGLDTATLAAAGEVLVAAGRTKEAAAVVDLLSKRVGPGPTAFGAAIRAQLAMADDSPAEARRILADTRQSADAWLLRFWLGRAYLALNMFAEADSEFDACLRRRGEAAAVFMDDFPTYHRLLEVYYYQGLAREGLKSPGAAESFKLFLAPKDNGDETGGLVADARKRVAVR